MPRRELLLESCEERILCSASVPQDGVLEGSPSASAAAVPAAEPEADPTDAPQNADTSGPVKASRELIVINRNLPNAEGLIAEMTSQLAGRSFEVAVLETNQDGIAQLTARLAQAGGAYDAVHILTHGQEGGVLLGATWLDTGHLADYEGQLAQWRTALTASGDLIFYGCDLAADEAGQLFVQQIAQLTGADVAASADATGGKLLGGNWTLEYVVGQVETQLSSTGDSESWNHLLGYTPLDGGTGSFAAAIDNRLYAVNFDTGKATLMFTDTALSTINSLGYDSVNDIYYYADSAAGSTALYGWDARAGGARFVLTTDVTTFGVSLPGAGLGAAGGDFSGGSYYFSTEGGGTGGGGGRDQLYKVDFTTGSNGRTIDTIQLISNNTIPGANEFGDFLIDAAAGKVYVFDSGNGVREYNLTLGSTPSLTFVETDSSSAVRQAARDRNNTMYAVDGNFRTYTPTGGGSFGTARNITTDGTTAFGSATDGAAYMSADGTIGDRVWFDTDTDGVQDGGEEGIVGLTVSLYYDLNGDGTVNGADSLIATTTTGANGAYSFAQLLPDTYIIQITDPTNILNGGTSTTGGNAQTAAIALVGQAITNKDFGFRDNRPAVSVNNVAVTEGTDAHAQFTVSLSRTYAQALTVNLALANGTASGAGTDFGTGGAGNLQVYNGTTWVDATTATFAAGTTSVLVRTPITNDTTYEASEAFTLTATRTNTLISNTNATGTATIADNDAAPAYTINDVTRNEAAGTMTFTVTLTGTTALASTVNYATASGTATSGADFTSTSGTLTFAAGSGARTQTVNVPITNDTTYERSETFAMNLTGATNATISDTQGVGTILDDGTGGGGTNNDTPTLSVNNVSATEGTDAYAVFIVSLSNASTTPVTLSLALANGTATGAGTDFGTGGAGNLQVSNDGGATWNDATTATIVAGSTSVRVRTPIVNDTLDEAAENFTLTATRADAVAGSADQIYALQRLNAYRALVGAAPLTMDAHLNVFAVQSSQALLQNNQPHQYFDDAFAAGTLFTTDGFSSDAAENQGDQFGWPPRVGGVQQQIDEILAAMWAEGPGGGHYDTMIGSSFGRAGIGLVTDGTGRLYFTNEFTGAASATTNVSVTGTGTIVDNDPAPTVTISDATAAEGDPLVFGVTLSNPSSGAIVLNLTTTSGTATGGTDYETTNFEYSTNGGTNWLAATSGTQVTLPAGSTGILVRIDSTEDALDENNETFTLSVASVVSGTAGSTADTGLGTITDDDAAPGLSINDVTRNEAAGTITFTVTLNAPSALLVSVNYAAGGGTATSGTDYTAGTNPLSGTLNFAAGVTSQTITLAITNDTLFEQSESFNVTLSGASNATITDATGVGTIRDDGTGGGGTNNDTPTLAVNNVTVTEGTDSHAVFNVTLSNASTTPVTVNVALANGTATGAGTDFGTGGAGNLQVFNGTAWVDATSATFAAGATVVQVRTPITNDALDENAEAFTLTATRTAGTTTNGSAVGTATITDNDAAPGVSINDVTRNEAAGTITFTVILDAPSALPVTVDYAAASGTATSGTDFAAGTNALSGTLSFGPGVTTQTITLAITNDAVFEQSESFNVVLSNATNATITDATGVGTILDDGTGGGGTDNDTPALAVNNVAVTEGTDGYAIFNVTLSNASATPVTVGLVLANGTATGTGTDYGTSGVANLQVFNGTTWVDATSATFAAGATVVQVRTPIVNDALDENAEAFTLTATRTSGTTTNTSATGTATITDNDPAPSIAINDVSINENAGTMTFTVSLSAASALPITVDYASASGSATSGTDFGAVSGTLNFAAGETTKTINVSITNDLIDEADETLNINLTNATNATIADSQGVGTILDNDPAPTVTISDATAAEGDPLVFAVTLSNPSSGAIVLNLTTTSGTATGGTDYEMTNFEYSTDGGSNWIAATGGTQVTLPAGSTGILVRIDSTEDALDENDETFTLSVASVVSGTAGSTADTGLGTVTDDDAAPGLSIGDVTRNEGAGTITFTVTLDAPSALPITVNYAAASGTATSGVDFAAGTNPLSGTLNFAAGVTSQTITLAITNDTLFEQSESFSVVLSNATNSNIADATGVGTILDDGAGGGATDNDTPTLAVNDVSATEGTDGYAVFNVTLSNASTTPVTVGLALANGTATGAGADYGTGGVGNLEVFNGTTWVDAATATFAAGATVVQVRTPITNDTLDENAEAFTLTATRTSGTTTNGSATGTGTIVDNDPAPTVTISDATAAEGDPLVFAVTLSNPSSGAIVLNLTTTSGTATGGTDFETTNFEYSTDGGTNWLAATGGTQVTVPAGSTGILVRVDSIEDALDENNETFTLSVSSVVSGTVGSTADTGLGTITDDDATPGLSINDVTRNEAAGTITFTVILDAPSALPVTVDYAAASGTATSGTDFAAGTNALSGTLSFGPGVTSQTITLAITNDAVFEQSESFNVVLSNATNAVITDATGIGTILDDGTGGGGTDNDTPSLSVPNITVTEGTDPYAIFTVSLSNPSTTPVTVNLALANGTAVGAGTDYGTSGAGNLQVFVGGVWVEATSATIPAGETSVLVRTPITDDALNEASETLTLTATRTAGTTVNISATGTATIDDADPAPNLVINDVTINEGAGTATFTVTLNAPGGQTVTVNYSTANSTATAGADYSSTTGTLTFAPGALTQTVSVSILNDAVFEGSETFNVVLATAVNATIADATGLGTILDNGTGGGGTDNDTPSLAVSSPTVTEGADPHAVFTVSLSNPSTTDVTVALALANGSASGSGTDYGTGGVGNLEVFVGGVWTDATTATIAAGTTSVLVRTPITNDALSEAIEDFTLMATRTAGTTSNPGATGTGTIVDDDGAPTLLINDVTVNEGAGTMTFTVSLSAPSGQAISVNYATASGTATTGVDFTSASGTLNFAPGVTSQIITVSIANDALFENSEALNVNLSGAVNATIADGTGLGTILDNGTGSGGTDNDTPTLTVSNVAVTEGTDAYAIFTVGLSNLSTTPVSVNLALAGVTAAGAGVDFGAGLEVSTDGISWTPATAATIAAGTSSVFVRTPITNDALDEAAETFTLTATRSAGTTTNATATGTATIADNDLTPSLSINDVTVNEAAGTATFTVSLSAPSGQTVTVNYATSDGTATGADYTPTGGIVTFAAGETSRTFTVAILNDTIFENSEAFNVALSAPTNATIADNLGIGTIRDDGTGAGGTDNDTPTVNVSGTTVTEGTDNFAVFTVSLSNASATATTFNLALANVSATGAGSDYGTAGAGNLEVFVGGVWTDATSATIPAGTLSVQVRTPITNDALDEAAETFTLTATRASGTTTNVSATGTATILDDDATPTFVIDDVTVNEATGTATFTVTLSAPSGQVVSVNYATNGGTATAGLDYLTGSGTLNFAPGVVTQVVSVSILNDAIFENSEAFTVTLSAPTNAAITDATGLGTIKDDGTGTGGTDNDTPTLAVDDVNVTEGTDGFAVFTVSLSNASTTDVTLALSLADGTALGGGTDFGAAVAAGNLQVFVGGVWIDAPSATMAAGTTSVLVRTPINNDALSEAIEDFALTATVPSGPTTNASATGTATIADDDGAPTLSINDVTVNESAGTATFTVTLSAPSGQTVDVNFTTNSGTATTGADFTAVSGALTFTPGVTSQTVTVSILNDTTFENSEAFTVTLSGAVNAAIADANGVGTILDNGSGPGGSDNDTPALSVSNVAVTEGTDPFAVFQVALSNPSSTPVSVSLALANGTAIGGGTDFGTSGVGNLEVFVGGVWTNATTATIAAGATSVLVRTPVSDDALDEAAETLTLTAAVTSGTTSNASATGTATITDNDAAPALSVNDVTVNEAAGTATFTVSLAAPSGQTVTVNFATGSGTATSGADFASNAGALTFAAGVTSQTVTVAITNDTTFEVSENFTVTLSGAVNATIADGTGVGTVLDDGTGPGGTDNDTPNLTVSNVTVTEGVDSFAVFAVNLSNRSATSVDVLLTLSDGTALGGGVDYGSGLEVSTDNGSTWVSANIATIAPGTDGVLVRTPIQNDPLDEPTENFTLTATVTWGVTVNTSATGTATINDNDPTPTLTIDDVIVNEAAGTITFTVNLSAASGQTVTVNYATSDGTATAGTDYAGGTGTLTFSPTVIGQTITLPITNDAIFENSESFTVTLSGAVNAIITDSTGIGTIRDDGTGAGGGDNDTPTLAVNDVTVTEGTDGYAVFNVTLSNASTTPVTVGLALANGSASGAGTDYGTSGVGNLEVFNGTIWVDATSATLAAGTTTVQVRTPITNDLLDENAEPFTLTATRISGTTVNASATGTATITDNDAPPALSIDDVTVNEAAGTATFTVTLDGASGLPITVDYAMTNGTAGAADYTAGSGTVTFAAGETSQTITVPISEDLLDELDETFNVNLSNATNATIADATGLGTIVDNDGAPTVTIGDATSTEGAPLVFAVTLSNPSSTPIVLDLATASGTATSGVDVEATNFEYSIDGGGSWIPAAGGTQVTIPTGSTGILVRIDSTADVLDENDETFTLRVASVVSGTVSSITDTGLGTITDDDASPALSIDDVTVNEAAGTITFTVTLDAVSGLPITVNYAMTNGTADAGDYTAGTGMLSFAAGVTSQTITVPILNDTISEGSENFRVTLSAPVNATIADGTGAGTILDDGTGPGGTDDDRPVLSVSEVTVTEGVDPYAVFTVSLSNPATTPNVVDLVLVQGSATGLDFGPGLEVSTDGGVTWGPATSATFAPGQTSVLVRTPIAADNLAEEAESFTLTATVTSGSAKNLSATGTADIVDTPPVIVPPLAPPAPRVVLAPPPAVFDFAFDDFNNFSGDEITPRLTGPWQAPRVRSIDPSSPALLPLAPIYSGEADPGATLVIEIYNSNGVRIGSQTVLADAGGNWLANFGGAAMRDAPSDVRITQVSAHYAFGAGASNNLRTCYAPTAVNPGHFLSQSTDAGFADHAAPLLGGLDLANPIQLGAVKYGAEFLPSDGVASGG